MITAKSINMKKNEKEHVGCAQEMQQTHDSTASLVTTLHDNLHRLFGQARKSMIIEEENEEEEEKKKRWRKRRGRRRRKKEKKEKKNNNNKHNHQQS